MPKKSAKDKKKAHKVSFESSNEVVMKYGPSQKSFVQLARTKVKGGRNGDSEIISISKGYYDRDDNQKFAKSIGIPADKKSLAWFKKEVAKL